MAVGSNGFIYSGEQSCMMDVSNNFAGTLMGIINALGKIVILNILDDDITTDVIVTRLGNVMGFVAPQVTGLIIKGHNDIDHWQEVFLIAAAIYIIGDIVFVIFGKAEEQRWNRTD